jgi:RNA polymerase-binding transcription factor DksA
MGDPGPDDALRRLVVAERDTTATQLAALRATYQQLVDAADLEPPDDEHDPDGTTAYERAQVASLVAEAEARLAALDRTLAGSVDLRRCEACGGPIGSERLVALPGVRSCIACAAQGR